MGLHSDNTSPKTTQLPALSNLTFESPATVNMKMQHENGFDEKAYVKQPEPLKIIIAGAGIGGFTAALALRQQGHHVEIYESSGFSRETGAALHVAPNANGPLKRLGIDCEAIGANKCLWLSEYLSNGVKQGEHDLSKIIRNFEHSWRLAHRVRLHDALRKAATGEDGVGRPAILHLSKPVKDVDTANAVVFFKDGTSVQGDVVLGADGVHSVTRTKLPGGRIQPFSSGVSAFRFLVPKEMVSSNPRTAKWVERDGDFPGFFGPDRSVIMYPTSNNTILNVVCIHPESASSSTDGWGSTAPLSKLLEVYEGFHPDILALLERADEHSLKVWKLLDMDELPTWCEGRLAVLGDAAHPFLPYLGQGGAIAIEDGVALGVVLEAGTTKEEIPERLKLYERIRKARATQVQDYTRRSGKARGEKGSFNVAESQNYCFAHDEFTNSHQKLREWKWAQSANPSKNMTSVFGPSSSLSANLTRRFHPSFTTASIRFDTSHTVVKSLLPPGNNSYRFKMPGSIAQCTFSQTTLRGLPWLGGRGYDMLGLYIHGVQHQDASGDAKVGAFLPIVFENMADNNKTQSSAPKAWSTIDIERDHKSYHIRAGWQGLTWGNFCLDGLEMVTEDDMHGDPPNARAIPDASRIDQGTLLHHYDPEHVSPTVVDQALPAGTSEFVLHRPEKSESRTVPHRVWKAKSAQIKLNARDWEALPTLHHIISRLAEIPIFNVIEAKLVDGHGVPDFA